MSKFIIEQKMSGTGTIHDLASAHFDREIEFSEKDEYAVITCAHCDEIRYFFNEYDAADFASDYKDTNVAVIDKVGNFYRSILVSDGEGELIEELTTEDAPIFSEIKKVA